MQHLSSTFCISLTEQIASSYLLILLRISGSQCARETAIVPHSNEFLLQKIVVNMTDESLIVHGVNIRVSITG